MSLPDHIVSGEPTGVIWYQRNESSIWPLTLDLQSLGAFKAKSSDPLLHRTFGGLLTGAGFRKEDDSTLVSTTAMTSAVLTVTVHGAQTDNVAFWLDQIRATAAASAAAACSESKLWRDHQNWWQEFWARSYIRPEARGPDWNQAASIAEQSAWQRYLVACCGRGLYPVKFNGGLFTADWGIKDEAFDADYRRWGGGYWFQNTRLIYWALLANGDYELLRPYFRMYRDMLPLAEYRTQQWYGHGGVFFPETLYFWGLQMPSGYGWNRAGKPPSFSENLYSRYHWTGDWNSSPSCSRPTPTPATKRCSPRNSCRSRAPCCNFTRSTIRTMPAAKAPLRARPGARDLVGGGESHARGRRAALPVTAAAGPAAEEPSAG